MTVLVLCEELDITADRVVAELTDRGVPVFRIDTAWFPTELSLDATLRAAQWTGTLCTSYRQVSLDEVRSVWFRRPTAFRLSADMSAPERRHAAWEAKFGLGGVLTSLPVPWVNHPGREADACYKPAQLAVARQCGMTTPDSLVTNSPTSVCRFVAEHPGGVVVKTLSTPAVLESGGVTLAHTHRLTTADLSDLSGVNVTAHLFQSWIDKAFEVRVTAVGKRLFSVAIDASTDAAREDWRNDFDALTYRVVQPPPDVISAVAAYLTRFGLAYAAFDFAVARTGEWVFLEANPGGQYGWLEAATGLPISTAIADLLERGTG